MKEDTSIIIETGGERYEEMKPNAVSACVPAVFGVMACVWNVVGGINYAAVAVGVVAVAAAGVVYGWGKEC